jgi:hypothetical protein
MKIKRGWQLFAAVIELAIMAAVALFGAVMIAVPVPILLHFLSKYGVTETPATMICRLAGVLLLIAGLERAAARRPTTSEVAHGDRPPRSSGCSAQHIPLESAARVELDRRMTIPS